MLRFKLLILFVLNIFCLQTFAKGPIKAIITTPNAIIYSDTALKSPIGKVSFGKIIYVGKIKRRFGDISTVVVSGKLAYIKTEDYTEFETWKKQTKNGEVERLRATEHDIDKILIKDIDRLSENNYLVLTGGRYSLGTEWDVISEEFGDGSGNGLFNGKALFEHRPEIHKFSWGVGIGQYLSNQTSLSLSITTLELMLYYSFLNAWDFLSLDFQVGTLMTAAFTLETSLQDRYSGSLFGYIYGVQARLLPRSKIGAVLGVQYQLVNISGLDAIVINETTNRRATLESFSGAQFFMGLSYKFN